MTPIREILEKHKELVFRANKSNGIIADKYAIMDSEFEAIEKELNALYIPYIYSPRYYPSESDFT